MWYPRVRPTDSSSFRPPQSPSPRGRPSTPGIGRDTAALRASPNANSCRSAGTEDQARSFSWAAEKLEMHAMQVASTAYGSPLGEWDLVLCTGRTREPLRHSQLDPRSSTIPAGWQFDDK